MMSIDSVQGKAVEGFEFVVRFRQTAPVELLDIAGPASFEPMSADDIEPMADFMLTREFVESELDQDFAELEMLKDLAANLEDAIRGKERFLEAMSEPEDEDGNAPKECHGVLCFLKGLFDRLTGLGHPGRRGWPHKGHCGNHTRGNHTHGNHTFPHPPWWKHPHGNHTHGNHTFPHPPWWRHPHGNHTHGNHTHGNHSFPHPRPPFHHRPPLFCRPFHRPPHGKPPHGKPPHGKPPHEKPPHGKPPHSGPRPPTEPPHVGPSFKEPDQQDPIFPSIASVAATGSREEEQDEEQTVCFPHRL